jgi:hypothetical protein
MLPGFRLASRSRPQIENKVGNFGLRRGRSVPYCERRSDENVSLRNAEIAMISMRQDGPVNSHDGDLAGRRSPRRDSIIQLATYRRGDLAEARGRER